METMNLRRMTTKDSILVFAWRNDSETREASFQTELIDWSTHCSWFQGHLTDPWYVGELSGVPVGHIRFTLANGLYVASVVIDPFHRRKGYGTQLIKLGIRQLVAELGCNEVLAEIKYGNTASEKAFGHAGFNIRSSVYVWVVAE